MEKHILDRYARTDDGKVVIDISADRFEDLYNYYDKSAPYLKKDLEPELVDYLVDCVREVGDEAFVLRVNLDGAVEKDQRMRLRESVNRYFLYLKELELRELKNMFRTSLILLAVGIGILTMSVWLNRMIEAHETVISRVFAEGLTVAAWVSLWEALATFLINWAPHRRMVRLYQRVADAPVTFSASVPSLAPVSAGPGSHLPGQ